MVSVETLEKEMAAAGLPGGLPAGLVGGLPAAEPLPPRMGRPGEAGAANGGVPGSIPPSWQEKANAVKSLRFSKHAKRARDMRGFNGPEWIITGLGIAILVIGQNMLIDTIRNAKKRYLMAYSAAVLLSGCAAMLVVSMRGSRKWDGAELAEGIIGVLMIPLASAGAILFHSGEQSCKDCNMLAFIRSALLLLVKGALLIYAGWVIPKTRQEDERKRA
mmetsp:Transcript_75206/g.141907  ORF Transcript_75206/g.141907 Transcript_75206/m.141907 type:complete len:218 (-) Transcript_75206:46-699(-)